MGKKKKESISQKQKKIILTIICFILLVIADRTGILAKIDEEIARTGLANVVDTSNTSNVSTVPEVKKDVEVVTSISENIVINDEKLNILYFSVGQADCQLIISNGQTMLIDAGNKSDGEKIVNAIKTLGINKLDYVIGTHVHEDHVGGMSYIIDNFEIGKFYLPYDTTTTLSYYKKLLTSLSNKGMSIEEAVIGDKINVGNSICEIMCVDNTQPENANEESIVIELTYGTQKYLFMADAESKNEKSRTWNDVDVLKVGHHGSNTSSTEDFLEQTLPEISIISVGEGNSYGLPKDKILNRLEKIGSKIYRTDLDGTIQLISDGTNNEIIKVDVSLDGN